MSIKLFKSNGKVRDLRTFVQKIDNLFTEKASTFKNDRLGKFIYAVENYNEDDQSPEVITARGDLEAIKTDIAESAVETNLASPSALEETPAMDPAQGYVEDGVEEEASIASDPVDTTNVGLEAAAITVAMINQANKYGVNSTKTRSGNIYSIEAASFSNSLDFAHKYSIESFDERNITEFMAFSVAFNFVAAQQDQWSEMFFPTMNVTPDNFGFLVKVRRDVLYKGNTRSLKGEKMEPVKTTLVDAFRNPRILHNDVTKIVPYVAPDGSTAQFFADAQYGLEEDYQVDGVTIKTSSYRPGVEMDVLGLSQHPTLVEHGMLNHEDMVDGYAPISQLNILIDGSVYNFDVTNFPRSQFNKTAEGGMNDMILQFSTTDISIHGGSKDKTDTQTQLAQDLESQGYNVRLSVRLVGELNLETGTMHVTPSNKLKVAKITSSVTGLPIDHKSGPGKVITERIEADIELVGYKADLRRTNVNLRTRGHLIDSEVLQYNFPIPLRGPLTTRKPINLDKEFPTFETLLNAARIQTTNNAVTTVTDYFNFLFDLTANRKDFDSALPFEGIGSLYVKPFCEDIEIDLQQIVNSTSSANKLNDIAGALTSVITEVASRAVRDSGYRAALNLDGGMNEKVNLLIGTDLRLANYIFRSGDDRTFGPDFTYQVASSPDERLDDTIYISFGRKFKGEPDVLSSGIHAYVPELIHKHPGILRQGSLAEETSVQLRNRHIVFLPIWIRIHVKGLEEFSQDAALYQTVAR